MQVNDLEVCLFGLVHLTPLLSSMVIHVRSLQLYTFINTQITCVGMYLYLSGYTWLPWPSFLPRTVLPCQVFRSGYSIP
jgi:hypothetical protein